MSVPPSAWFVGGDESYAFLQERHEGRVERLEVLPLESTDSPAVVILELSEGVGLESLQQLREDRDLVKSPLALIRRADAWPAWLLRPSWPTLTSGGWCRGHFRKISFRSR